MEILIDNILDITNSDAFYYTFNLLESYIDELNDDEIDRVIDRILHNITKNRLIYYNKEIITNVFIRYINYLKITTVIYWIDEYYFLLSPLIDYKPEMANEILKEYPSFITKLLEGEESSQYQKYEAWLIKYLPFVIEEKEEKLKELQESNRVDLKFIENNLNTFRPLNDLEPLAPAMNRLVHHNIYMTNLKNTIKYYYYILAQIKRNQTMKSDLDKEWVIRYLIRADDYIDSQNLREKLFREYYLGNMETESIPIDGNEETIIKFGNYIKNYCSK